MVGGLGMDTGVRHGSGWDAGNGSGDAWTTGQTPLSALPLNSCMVMGICCPMPQFPHCQRESAITLLSFIGQLGEGVQ